MGQAKRSSMARKSRRFKCIHTAVPTTTENLNGPNYLKVDFLQVGISPSGFPPQLARWLSRAYGARVRRIRTILCLVTGLTHLTADANVVTDWTDLMLDAVRTENLSPTLASRSLAILHSAIHDSINSVQPENQPYAFQVPVLPETSAEAAAVGAAYTILTNLYPDFTARSDALYSGWISGSVRNAALTNGLMLGESVAQMALQDRAGDGLSTEVPYIPSDEPGQWRRTPPFYRPPLDPHWGYLRPFCLSNVESFVPPPPPSLESPAYAAALNQVAELGSSMSSYRTPEQSQTAVFWSDFSYTCTPPGHMMLIAKDICLRRGLSLAQTSHLFTLISLALADSAIVCWETKYRYNFWRPITAIQRADEDGNPATSADPVWNQFLFTPNFPSYTSGHSTFSAAATRVIASWFRTDAVAFAVGSDTVPTQFRSYESLAACAEEIGMSRIYAGIHFSFDKEEGAKSGTKIADYVTQNYLLPNHSLPLANLEGFQNGAPTIRVHGRIGHTVVLEASADLVTWHGVQTNLAAIGGVLVLDHEAAALPQRFYRVQQK